MPGSYIISESNHAYRFELMSSNGDTILQSEPHPTKSYCIAAIQTLRENVGRAHCFEKSMKSNGQYYFIVKKENDGVIGTSVLYWSESSRDYAIMIVKREAVNAVLK